MIVIWNDSQFECSRAVRYADHLIMYDENDHEIQRIFNITENEWKKIYFQNGTEIPTENDCLRADLDFLTMENDSLRADLDYCLMLLDEEGE